MKCFSIVQNEEELIRIKNKVLPNTYFVSISKKNMNSSDLVEDVMDYTMNLLKDYWVMIAPYAALHTDRSAYYKYLCKNCVMATLFTLEQLAAEKKSSVDFADSIMKAFPDEFLKRNGLEDYIYDRNRVKTALDKKVNSYKESFSDLVFWQLIHAGSMEVIAKKAGKSSKITVIKPFMTDYRAKLYLIIYSKKAKGENNKAKETRETVDPYFRSCPLSTSLNRFVEGNIQDSIQNKSIKKAALKELFSSIDAAATVLGCINAQAEADSFTPSSKVDKALSYYSTERIFSRGKLVDFINDAGRINDETEVIVEFSKLLAKCRIPLVIDYDYIWREDGFGIPDPIASYIDLLYHVFLAVLYEECDHNLEKSIEALSLYIETSDVFSFLDQKAKTLSWDAIDSTVNNIFKKCIDNNTENNDAIIVMQDILKNTIFHHQPYKEIETNELYMYNKEASDWYHKISDLDMNLNKHLAGYYYYRFIFNIGI